MGGCTKFRKRARIGDFTRSIRSSIDDPHFYASTFYSPSPHRRGGTGGEV